MTRDDVINLYFEWLFEMVCGNRFAEDISFRKLISHLHNTNFRYSIRNDESRAHEGENLRHRFALTQMPDVSEYEILDILAGPCSVFEMMVALAVYSEEHVMHNPQIGDRTGQWFWGMIHNLGLSPMTDSAFDNVFVDNREVVNDIIARFLNREYEPDGTGGLFTVRHTPHDLRTVEIWCQLSWYLGSLE